MENHGKPRNVIGKTRDSRGQWQNPEVLHLGWRFGALWLASLSRDGWQTSRERRGSQGLPETPGTRRFSMFSWSDWKWLDYLIWLCYASGPKTMLVKRTFLPACVRRSWRGEVGWGGMLTFLVLLPLHVATLHGCLVVLLRFMHEGVGWGGRGGGHVKVPCASSATCCYADLVWVGNPQARWVWKHILPWNGEISCHTGTIDAAWSAVKDFIPNSLCSKGNDLLLYVKCWQWRCVNLHTHLQQKPISTLKHLLWKERKNLSTRPNDMNPKPTRNANLAKFSRENLAQFGLQKCLFRYGKTTIC